jgi:hypothetical protein
MKHCLDAASRKLPGLPRLSPVKATLTVAADFMVVWAILVSTGCGPLGLYSLVHSTLISHHVFKPIVADQPVNGGEDVTEHLSASSTGADGGKNSSHSRLTPKVITQSSSTPNACGAVDGDKPCLE